jgi:aryl-alcohol dehydrogenase-like predicted oxidoreductase
MTLPELALRHILNHPAVSTVIPGMRKTNHVERNLATADAEPLSQELVAELKRHRWSRTTDWE